MIFLPATELRGRFVRADLPGPGAGAADLGAGHPLHPQRGGLPLDGPDEAAAGDFFHRAPILARFDPPTQNSTCLS